MHGSIMAWWSSARCGGRFGAVGVDFVHPQRMQPSSVSYEGEIQHRYLAQRTTPALASRGFPRCIQTTPVPRVAPLPAPVKPTPLSCPLHRWRALLLSAVGTIPALKDGTDAESSRSGEEWVKLQPAEYCAAAPTVFCVGHTVQHEYDSSNSYWLAVGMSITC